VTRPCAIAVEDVDQPDIRGVRGVVKTPDGQSICATRVFSSVFPASAGDRSRAHARAVEMAEGLGYAEQAADAQAVRS